MSLLIKGGTIVTATDQYVGDVLVEGEKISTIGSGGTVLLGNRKHLKLSRGGVGYGGLQFFQKS